MRNDCRPSPIWLLTWKQTMRIDCTGCIAPLIPRRSKCSWRVTPQIGNLTPGGVRSDESQSQLALSLPGREENFAFSQIIALSECHPLADAALHLHSCCASPPAAWLLSQTLSCLAVNRLSLSPDRDEDTFPEISKLIINLRFSPSGPSQYT